MQFLEVAVQTVVFESSLDELLKKCVQCGCEGFITRKTIGPCLIVTTSCVKCDFIRTWTSQPMAGTMPYGNLILCAAIMFSGSSPVKCLRMLDFAGIENVSISMYNQRTNGPVNAHLSLLHIPINMFEYYGI